MSSVQVPMLFFKDIPEDSLKYEHQFNCADNVSIMLPDIRHGNCFVQDLIEEGGLSCSMEFVGHTASLLDHSWTRLFLHLGALRTKLYLCDSQCSRRVGGEWV